MAARTRERVNATGTAANGCLRRGSLSWVDEAHDAYAAWSTASSVAPSASAIGSLPDTATMALRMLSV